MTNAEEYKLDQIISMVKHEVIRAANIHGKFRSTHEGYAVLLEEVDELWDEVKKNTATGQTGCDEAKQVAAMAIRFIFDLCK